MGKNSQIVAYEQNDILSLLKVLNSLSKSQDTKFFYNFLANYGTKKVSDILNSRGFEMYGIAPSKNLDVVDIISKNIFTKITNKKYINSLLNSPYYYSKYILNPQTNSMTEQKIGLVYNVIVDNSKIDIKKCYTIDELKILIDNKNVVMLGVKEKPINSESYFFESLQEVDKNFIAQAKNGLIQKSIFPSIKFSDSKISQNLVKFENQYPNLNAEMTKVNKKVLHKVLQYEIQNQQIFLSSILENGQKQFKNLVNEYQTKANKIQKMIETNQKLLFALGEKQKTSDFEFDKTL